MQDGMPWPGNDSRDHPGMIQVYLGSGSALDVEGNELPKLVYVSREKRPGYNHHKKVGAMNALNMNTPPTKRFVYADLGEEGRNAHIGGGRNSDFVLEETPILKPATLGKKEENTSLIAFSPSSLYQRIVDQKPHCE
ncbi:hypothetical protein LXL04_032380 [Taraxacum kok-saghyz]